MWAKPTVLLLGRLALGEIRALPPGKTVWAPADKADSFVLVLSGQLRLWRHGHVIETAVPGAN